MTAKSIDADTGADTNLTITYASSDTAVVSIYNGPTYRIEGAGSATITASQAGNVDTGGRYNAATSVTKTITVGKASPDPSSPVREHQPTQPDQGQWRLPLPPAVKSVDASGNDTGLTLTYSSSNTAVIDVNGINLEPKGVGTATITVSQPGDTNYNAATSKTFYHHCDREESLLGLRTRIGDVARR